MGRYYSFRNVFVRVACVMGVVIGSFSSVFAQPAKAPLFAILLGGNEVTAAGDANVGDPDGNGSFTAILDGRTLCFGLVVNGIDTPTLMHIHENVAGLTGSVVVDLTTLKPTSGDPGTSSGCVKITDSALLSRLRTAPSGFYINVHNAAFPGGALRGQLF